MKIFLDIFHPIYVIKHTVMLVNLTHWTFKIHKNLTDYSVKLEHKLDYIILSDTHHCYSQKYEQLAQEI